MNPAQFHKAPIDLLVVAHSNFTSINRNVFVELANRGIKVELVIPERLPGFPGREADPWRDTDPPIHWVAVRGKNFRYWHIPQLGTILRQRKPRTVFLEGDVASRLAVHLSLWARKKETRLICYSNENQIRELKVCLASKNISDILRYTRSKLISLMSREGIGCVLVLSNASADSMRILGFGDRTHLMPLGYDPSVFHPDPPARDTLRKKIGLSVPIILYAGRMVKGKGVEYLLQALTEIPDLDWHFLLDDFQTGSDGSYPASIQKMLDSSPLLKERTTRFHANHMEIVDYINASDILVAPSLLPEQYGRILVEAMACGRSVIASSTGAYPEVIGDCGTLVPPGDVKALTLALREQILNDKMRLVIGMRARNRAASCFSLQHQADIIERFILKTTNQ